ncbi:Hypothetical protein NTJ_10618 [Nesidiocoris tenuis]|uniref:Uncharacterized protein n=1 Tax=Nesidiocoris tenuis TaxID=355587 RepID=A0ABN7B1W5_9HEMI|nr:Hypothetical protein NTJ_10618 [Nesidiocoris tenuis]
MSGDVISFLYVAHIVWISRVYEPEEITELDFPRDGTARKAGLALDIWTGCSLLKGTGNIRFIIHDGVPTKVILCPSVEWNCIPPDTTFVSIPL